MKQKILALAIFIPMCAFAFESVADMPSEASWLAFKMQHEKDVAGPTGWLAIQDMVEVEPGGTAFLKNASSPAQAALEKEDAGAKSVGIKVQWNGREAKLSGSGYESQDLLKAVNHRLELKNGLVLRASLLDQKTLKVWLYNPENPKRKAFHGLSFYPYDKAGVVTGAFTKNVKPIATPYRDSRNEMRVMYKAGVVKLRIGGRDFNVNAYTDQASWADIDSVALFLRDRTSGKTTYGGGRAFDTEFVKGHPPAELTFDFNRAYSFLCSYGPYFNCPLGITTKLEVEIPFGEKHSGH